jgi:hypothetical protein
MKGAVTDRTLSQRVAHLGSKIQAKEGFARAAPWNRRSRCAGRPGIAAGDRATHAQVDGNTRPEVGYDKKPRFLHLRGGLGSLQSLHMCQSPRIWIRIRAVGGG